jgi:hypothetical protein
MNASIEAVCRGGVWHLSTQSGGELSADDESVIRAAWRLGSRRARAAYEALGERSDIWQLEFSKACLGEGQITLGLAEQFALRCCEQPEARHTLRAHKRHLPLRTLAAALRARGQRVRRNPMWSIWDRIQLGSAVGIAALYWLVTLIRTLGEPKTLPRHSDFLVSAHGEWSNRTRHVLRQCASAGYISPVIVLGRPRSSLGSLCTRWKSELGVDMIRLVRPFGLVAAARSLPHAVHLIALGMRLIPALAYKPPFAELIAMSYRCFLGAASARWWARGGWTAGAVVYGHTGIADTTLLELAQQSGGARTIHAVHGVSAGLNFVARSSVGVFQCEHDARWHRRLGGYGDCFAVAGKKADAIAGGSGLLLLSNYIHPMNPWFRLFGIEDELRLLSIVASAADTLGIARSAIVWKPHPLFDTFPARVTRPVTDRVTELAFSRWREGAALNEAARFRYAVSTVSTVALDLLRIGIVPIILDVQQAMGDDALSCFPLQCSDAAGLTRAARMFEDQGGSRGLLPSVWTRIGPASAFRMDQALDLVRATPIVERADNREERCC